MPKKLQSRKKTTTSGSSATQVSKKQETKS